ncbi:MAG: tryptophan synthase subunit alpha [Lachnospiraceae bacterium]|jgi:tryptophan synthase alpha chain|nr:tryptophan synthase subunit alpha [Lachnospiraceae bacterium]
MNEKMVPIKQAFEGKRAFIAFVTAGDPSIERTEEYILRMVRAGADLIEIGIPFSDPTAEGPVIQEANIRALRGGVTVSKIFEMVGRVRPKVDVPLVFMTYLNPVYHYGYGAFFARCHEVGVSGIILPDLPFEEKGPVAEAAAVHGVDVVSLIAPTSKERIGMIAAGAQGFVYLVSSMGVTGVRRSIQTDVREMVDTVKRYTDVPVAVGFGIHTPEQAAQISAYADGVIVGSAIVKLIAEHGADAGDEVEAYVRGMKGAITCKSV